MTVAKTVDAARAENVARAETAEVSVMTVASAMEETAAISSKAVAVAQRSSAVRNSSHPLKVLTYPSSRTKRRSSLSAKRSTKSHAFIRSSTSRISSSQSAPAAAPFLRSQKNTNPSTVVKSTMRFFSPKKKHFATYSTHRGKNASSRKPPPRSIRRRVIFNPLPAAAFPASSSARRTTTAIRPRSAACTASFSRKCPSSPTPQKSALIAPRTPSAHGWTP